MSKLLGRCLQPPKAFGVRDTFGSRKRLPSRANPARAGFSAKSTISIYTVGVLVGPSHFACADRDALPREPP